MASASKEDDEQLLYPQILTTNTFHSLFYDHIATGGSADRRKPDNEMDDETKKLYTENVQKFSALTHQEKFEKVEQYLCHKHLGFSFSKFEKQSADWLQHTGEDGTIKQKSEYHSCGNCCRALFYEFPWISIITYCVLIAGLVMASTGLDPTVTTLLEVGLEDTSLITALFVTAGVVMLVVDAMAITTSVMCLGMVREVMWGKWGCCKPGYGDHHIQNGVYIEYVMAFLAFGSIVVMNFAVVTVSVAFVMVMMFTGVCDESDGTTRRQAAMATVMSLSPIEFISDDDTGGESYDRWMTGIADYCELTYETCMEDCNAGIIENDGDARWSAETCKCVYDRTDRQEQHSSYLLIGCAMMFFAQFNVLAISMVSVQRLKNEKNEHTALDEFRKKDVGGDQ